MEFPLENGIAAAIQGRRSLQGRRSDGDVRRVNHANLSKHYRQEDSLLRAFEEDDIELGLVSEGEDDSVETLPEHHPPKSPRR